MNKKLRTLLALAVLALASVPEASATITSTTNETVCALGNGVTTNYTIGFSFKDNDHIEVYNEDQSTTPYTRTLLVYGAGAGKYTITGGDPGTTVVMGTANTSSKRCIIKRVTPRKQEVDYEETESFPAEDHEEQMDKAVMMLQEMETAQGKKVGLHVASQATVPTFPDPIANGFVLYNNAGTALTTAGNGAISGDILQFDGSAWSLESLLTGFVKTDGSVPLTANWNAGAFDITASTFIGALTGDVTGNLTGNVTGNASTATALAANPTDCSATTFANSIVASGNLTCAQVDNTFVSASAAIDFSKLATLAEGNILVGSAGNVATSVAMGADATIVASGAVTIANDAVTNAKLANVNTATFKGRTSAGSGDPEDLTATQATALLNNLVGDSGAGGTKGLAPAPAAGDAAASKFLKADGTWEVPAGAGDVSHGEATSVDNEMVLFSGVGGKTIKRASGTGAVSVSSGVVTQGTLAPGNGGTGVTSPGVAGNTLKSNGTDWISAPPSQPHLMQNVGIADSVAASAWTVKLVQGNGSTNCAATAPCQVAMRDPTATVGGYNIRSVTDALSLVISAGTDLGLVSGASSVPVFLYLIDSDGAGTMKLGVSRISWSDQVLNSTIKESFNTSCTQASPSVCTSTGHGMSNGNAIQLTGTISGGLTTATTYYVVNKADDTFQLALTVGGTGINKTSGGTQTPVVHMFDGSLLSDGVYAAKPTRMIGTFKTGQTTAGTWAAASVESSVIDFPSPPYIRSLSVTTTCGSSPCTGISSSEPFFETVTRGGAGNYVVNFHPTVYTGGPHCWCTSVTGSALYCELNAVPTTTSVNVLTWNASGAGTDSRFVLSCLTKLY